MKADPALSRFLTLAMLGGGFVLMPCLSESTEPCQQHASMTPRNPVLGQEENFLTISGRSVLGSWFQS